MSITPVTPLRASRETVALTSLTTAFNTVAVKQTGERVDLEVEGATFATWHPKHAFTGYSWDGLSAAALLRSGGPPSSVLLLGLGGGTVTRQLRALLPQVRLVGVEIDGGVIDLARRYMGLDEQGVEVHIEDAYSFLARSTERFDVVLDDLFLTGPTDVVRTRVPQGETLALLRARVAPGGLFVANLITDAGEHKSVRVAARKAFADSFKVSRVVVPPRGLNEILVGGDEVLPRSSLAGWADKLGDAYDRARLSEIDVRLLKRN